MKKFISVLLAAALAATLCCVFASAEETNVALNKTWSGVEPHEAIPQYDNDLTDGVFDETGNFNYGDGSVSGSATPWFSFYCNGDRTNLTDRVGKVDIDLAGEGLGITKVRMQVAPMIEHAEYIKVYADGEEIGTLSCTEGATIEWLELALPEPIDADVISVEIKIKQMFFMVSEIEVYATGESAEGGDGSADTSTDAESSAAESSEPEDSSTAAVSSEAAASSSAASSTPSTSDTGVAAVAVGALAALAGAAVVLRKRA